MPRRILIVDDNVINRRLLTGTLHKEYDVAEAASGEEALEMIRRGDQPLSAVLLDIVMPGMNGYDVLRALRDDPLLAQLPVIMVTGSEDEESRVKALTLGANDFILKPFNPEIVKHCLKNNIALWETASLLNAIQKDKLTGLFNREAFFERVAGAVREKEPGYYILSSFDIDNFKLINDQFGVAEGNRILHEIGKTVAEDMEEIGGIGGRISADNFAVLIPQHRREMSITRTLRQNRMAFSEKQAISFSVGRYVVTDLSLPASALYDRAYIAKQSVKGRYDVHIAYFDDTMLETLVRDQGIIADMDEAIAKQQFEVWYQPQHNHCTGALIGAEALVRWRHPHKGMISPGVFIPVFEQTGFIYELDKYVWEQVCRQMRKWMDAGNAPLPVSVNLSRYDIFRADLLDVLTGLIERYSIPVDMLRLEITESAFAKSTQGVVHIVRQLIDRGFTVEIDDFGSGYSSLNTLKSVPAQIVKLDMHFLEDNDGSGRGGNILESVVRMTKWLGMAVIAEGVEKKAQADFLASIGCSYIQGFLYAKPMPAADYEAYCRNAAKEKRLLSMEAVANLDNNAFWDPKSMDTLIFNSYVGAACIFEYYNRRIELLRVNTKFTAILGDGTMSIEDTLKLDWISCLTPESLASVRDILQRSSQTGEEFTREYEFLNIPGAPGRTWLRASMRVIAMAGERMLVYCASENITRIMEAEMHAAATAADAAASVQETLSVAIQSVMDHSSEVSFIKGPDLRYISCSRRFAQLAGRSSGKELIGKRSAAVFPPALAARNEENDRAVLDSGRSYVDIDIPFPTENGTRQLLFSKYPLLDAQGNVLGIYGTGHDVTETREMTSRLELLTDSIPGGLMTYEVEAPDKLRLIFFNEGINRLFGMTHQEYAEACAAECELGRVFEEDRPTLRAQLKMLIASGAPVTMHYRIHVKGGGYRWISPQCSQPKKWGDKTVIHVALFDVTEREEAVERLRISEEENRLAIQHSKTVVCRYDVSAGTLMLPPGIDPIYDAPSVITDVPYGQIRERRISAQSADAYIAFYESIRSGEPNGKMLYQRISQRGWRWMEAFFSTIFSKDGKPVTAVISFMDVTDRLEKEAVYKKWQQSLLDRDIGTYMLFRSNISKNTVFDSIEGCLLPIACPENLTSFDQQVAYYTSNLVAPEDRKRYLAALRSDALLAKYYRGERTNSFEYRELTAGGGRRWLKCTVEMVEYPNSTDIEAYLMYEDIDEAKRAELSMIERAETDPLTGALNRAAFAARVGQLLPAMEPDTLCALMMLDVDGFKQVNDVFGHGVGDQALIDIAEALRSVLRKGDLLCRLGGDEFLVFLSDLPHERVAANKARRICTLVRKSFGEDVQISGSIGIALAPRDGMDFETLYKNVDAAMYCVKGTGKNSFAFYREDAHSAHTNET